MPDVDVVPVGATEQNLAQAAALRILDSEEPPAPKVVALGGPKPAPAPVPEPAPAPAPEPEPSPDPEPQPEPDPDAPEPEPQPEPEPATPAPGKFKVKIREDDGAEKELEVDEHELKNGYVRQQVYQRKTAQLAVERAGLKDEIKKSVEPAIKEYQERLNLFEKALWHSIAPEVQGTDWTKLAKEDPAQWAAKMQSVNNVNGILASIKQENERIAGARQQEAREIQERAVKESIEVLRRDVPNWSNDLYGKVLKAGTDHYGFKPEEVNAITDPRAIRVLNDARLYRELQAARPQVSKKVVDVPKVVKPGAAPVTRATGREDWQKGIAKLRQSGGSERHALSLAAQIFEREGIK